MQPAVQISNARATSHACPNCGSAGMTIFYEKSGAPVHSVVLLPTLEQALAYPTGDIALGFCERCGFVSNLAYDANLQDYATDYESTQSYSPTFNAFAQRLAQRLIDRYDLHGKEIVEIGCGQGEFLYLLCELGDNRGTGFDPAYRQEAVDSPARDRVQIVADYYSERYAQHNADLVVCKMTLEHIDRTGDFVRTVRRAVGDRHDTVIFFQVPNGEYVMRDVAFWDVYYEHCSYFSEASLAHLFRSSGFEVLDLAAEYDDQYLMIEARPVAGPVAAPADDAGALARMRGHVAHFAAHQREVIDGWRDELTRLHADGQRVVIWGGGSKGVAFLTTVGIRDEIAYVVDINPRKQGMFMAGTGQQIVGPEFLREVQPQVVVVMNPIYCDEIGEQLAALGVHARLLPV